MRRSVRRAVWIGIAGMLLGAGVAGCTQVRTELGEEPTASLRAKGNAAFSEGRYGDALRAFRAIAEEYPESAHARFDIGRTLLAAGDPLGASEELMVAHRRRPWAGEYTDLLGEALYQAGRKDTLFEMLRREAARSDNAADHLRLARFARRDGALDEAISAYERAAALSGERDLTALLELADLYRELGDRAREIETLARVIASQPGHPAASARLRALGEVPGPTLAIEGSNG